MITAKGVHGGPGPAGRWGTPRRRLLSCRGQGFGLDRGRPRGRLPIATRRGPTDHARVAAGLRILRDAFAHGRERGRHRRRKGTAGGEVRAGQEQRPRHWTGGAAVEQCRLRLTPAPCRVCRTGVRKATDVSRFRTAVTNPIITAAPTNSAPPLRELLRARRWPAAAKTPSSSATRPMSRSPETRTNGDQFWTAANLASLGFTRMAAPTAAVPNRASSQPSRLPDGAASLSGRRKRRARPLIARQPGRQNALQLALLSAWVPPALCRGAKGAVAVCLPRRTQALANGRDWCEGARPQRRGSCQSA